MTLNGGIAGLADLNAALTEIGDGEALAKALADTAEAIRQRAVANLTDGAPPDSRTGALAQSLIVAPDAEGGFTVSTPLDHGWHLEFGGSTRPAAPWLTPAAEDAQSGLVDRISDSLNDTIADALRRTR